MTDTAAVLDAITSRRSVRAFRPDPVAPDVLDTILASAARAPSGTNLQPWQVIVLQGQALQALGDELAEAFMAGDRGARENEYYPLEWREPYIGRRRKVGWALYDSLGITKGDGAAMQRQHARNFRFFDAPVGLLFTMDRDMQIGSWLDLGMYMQNVMTAARAFGLDTCAQAAFADHHARIQRRLAIAPERQIICGMALGFARTDAPENGFATEREPLSSFARFIDRLD